jgi:hypothetical protein
MAGVCVALSAWIAWKHPLVELTCGPRAEQPPANGGEQRAIVDGTVTQRAWGLFQVGRVELRHVRAFLMHTASSSFGGHTEALHAMTRDGRLEVFGNESSGVVRIVASLNSLLDHPAPAPTTLRRTHRFWFVLSWMLLALGALVLVRNVILVLWRRKSMRGQQSRVHSQRD